MITIWKQKEVLQQIQKFERNCWVNVINPTQDEILRLITELRVPDYFISDILDIDERSRIENDVRWFMIITRIPIYRFDNNVPFVTVPQGILISAHSIITICISDNEIINDLINPLRYRTVSLTNKVNFVLEIFLRSATQYLKYLKEINILTNEIEKELEKSTKNKELHKLLKMEKCLVYFITSIKSNDLLLFKLQKSRFLTFGEVDEDLLDDVQIEIKQALETAQIYSDIQSGLMDAFASVISNNLNVVMKQLTAITILLMIPNLIAGFFGMNVINFLEDNKYAMTYILSGSSILAVLGFMIFKKRDWF